jgi:hypothetical protein
MSRARLTRLFPIGILVAFPWFGCGASKTPPSAPDQKRTVLCGIDEVREYYCDDFLPLENALPAPAPYEACPETVENPPAEHDPAPRAGLFDASYTEYTRRRAPPGHSCCYSWCAKVTLADPQNPAAQSACRTGLAFREEYCMSELERGTALPAEPPFDRCPAAIVPPRKAVFSVPEAALLDPGLSGSHRAKGAPECCYAWCSQAPAGSGLLKAH